jgi:hypothetical protein
MARGPTPGFKKVGFTIGEAIFAVPPRRCVALTGERLSNLTARQ